MSSPQSLIGNPLDHDQVATAIAPELTPPAVSVPALQWRPRHIATIGYFSGAFRWELF